MSASHFEIRIGSESQKSEIYAKYPHTKLVIREGGALMVAVDGNEIIGFLWMFKRKISAPIDEYEWFINVIDVPDAANRCKGVASGLVKEAKRFAKSDGAYQISAYCDIANIPSHMLWRKNGFAIQPAYGADGAVVGSFVGFVL